MDYAIEQSELSFDLRHYLYILKRRLWLFITVFVTVSSLLIVRSYYQIPIYRATTTLIIEQEIPTMQFDMTGRGFVQEYLGTQKEIIQSHIVSQKALVLLGREVTDSAVADLKSRITVEPIKQSSLVRISIDHPEPETALKEVNAVAKAFINRNMEDKKSASQDTFTWLSEQLVVLKANVTKTELALLQFQEKEDIASMEKRQMLLEEKLSSVNEKYNQAVAKSMELATLLDQLKAIVKNPEMAESLPRVLSNELIQMLKSEHSRLESELAKISSKYKDKHPKIVSLKSQISSVRNRLAAEVTKIVKSIEIEYQISKTNEAVIKDNLDSLKRESMQLAKQAIQYGVLKREAESNKQMYDIMLNRLKQTDISGSITANNIRIVDEAKLPTVPIKPQHRKDIMIAVAVGLALGIGLCFFLEYMDNTIQKEEDCTFYLKEKVLGITLWDKKLDVRELDTSDALLRSYRDIRTILNMYRSEHVLKTILVTSTVREEGKTITSLMLGKVFAQTQIKVLLIDADLYRPQLAKRLNVHVKEGLTDYFNKEHQDIHKLIVETQTPYLYLLPSGLIPRNPSEIIESDKMKEIIETLKNDFDIVIVDTPPLTPAFEVSALSRYMDGVIYTVRANSTPRNLIQKTLEKFKLTKANILGIVVMGIRQDYGEDYYIKYKYYENYYQSVEKKQVPE